jgi:NTP pyrophosphatase (non-canonical NTP hydrolase)
MTALEHCSALIAEFKLGHDPASRALDLSSEVGELCKEVLKGTQYGSHAFQTTANLELELGDAYFSLLILAASVNVDLDVALERALAKMRDRLEQSGQLGSIF